MISKLCDKLQSLVWWDNQYRMKLTFLCGEEDDCSGHIWARTSDALLAGRFKIQYDTLANALRIHLQLNGTNWGQYTVRMHDDFMELIPQSSGKILTFYPTVPFVPASRAHYQFA
ncbi:MAG TPA: hypothetical protein DCE41_02690 [Cytophagales bacterium]|nr:hypothetical protein [Cytophagales bacterium]HAA23902.1 hypothetical protein [Cytophagales bacterium]HAP60616.1 hypothetical protein [Cytophagales bacterium]